MNFSLTVDPLGRRPPGSGNGNASVIITPLCDLVTAGGFPPAARTQRQCGSSVALNVNVFSGGDEKTLSHHEIITNF